MTVTGGTDHHAAGHDPSGPVEVDAEQMLTLDGGASPWRRPPRDTRTPRPAKVGATVEALIAAGVGLLVLPGLGQLQRQALMSLGTEGFVVGVVLSVAAAFGVASALHRWLGGGRRRDAAAVGAVAAALAGTAWGAITIAGGWSTSAYLPPRTVLWAAALGAAVLAVRTHGVGARCAGGFAGVLTALAVVSGVQTGWPLLSAYLPAPAEDAPSTVSTAESLPSAPAPPEVPTAGPTFGNLCHTDELEVTTTVPEPGGNDVATTLTATNVGTRECTVEGWPTIRIWSDGEDLALNVQVRHAAPAGEHVDPVEVRLTPGASARTQVWWPSWGAAADLEASQVLWVGVGGVEVVDLPPADRWDVVRSAEAFVAPWQPADPGR